MLSARRLLMVIAATSVAASRLLSSSLSSSSWALSLFQLGGVAALSRASNSSKKALLLSASSHTLSSQNCHPSYSCSTRQTINRLDTTIRSSSSIRMMGQAAETVESGDKNQRPNDDNNDNTATRATTTRVIRILALHGSEGNAKDFYQRLQPWSNFLAQQEKNDDDNMHDIRLDITTITAPVPKGRGHAWWAMAPGKRSFTATKYERFDESCAAVLAALTKDEAPPFDYLLGFSQGAILATCLLALNKLPLQQQEPLGCILMGAAWPNPYTPQMETLTTTDENARRILIVSGQEDNINSFDQSLRIEQALRQGGHTVTLLPFVGGHVVPSVQHNPDIVQTILEWMIRGKK